MSSDSKGRCGCPGGDIAAPFPEAPRARAEDEKRDRAGEVTTLGIGLLLLPAVVVGGPGESGEATDAEDSDALGEDAVVGRMTSASFSVCSATTPSYCVATP